MVINTLWKARNMMIGWCTRGVLRVYWLFNLHLLWLRWQKRKGAETLLFMLPQGGVFPILSPRPCTLKGGVADADETKEAVQTPRMSEADRRTVLRGAWSTAPWWQGEQQQAWLQQAVAEGKGKIPEGTSFVCSVLKGRSCSDSNRGRSYQTAPWWSRPVLGREELAEPVQALSW